MWYLFLDESGDLGFDFVNKNPIDYFTVCILATSSHDSVVGIRKAIKTTLRRKVNRGKRPRAWRKEIKATQTSLAAKAHFYRHVSELRFGIYALTLNKRRVHEQLVGKQEHVYNYVARLVLDRIPFEKASSQVHLVIDRSKGKVAIAHFNNYVISQLEGRLPPEVLIEIDHVHSHEDAALQAADLFAWGIFRKHEMGDAAWYDLFKEKIRFEDRYL